MQITHENTKRTKISKAISCMSRPEAFLKNKDSLSQKRQHCDLLMLEPASMFQPAFPICHPYRRTRRLGKQWLQSWLEVIFIAQDIFFPCVLLLLFFFLVLFSFVFNNYKFKLREACFCPGKQKLNKAFIVLFANLTSFRKRCSCMARIQFLAWMTQV